MSLSISLEFFLSFITFSSQVSKALKLLPFILYLCPSIFQNLVLDYTQERVERRILSLKRDGILKEIVDDTFKDRRRIFFS